MLTGRSLQLYPNLIFGISWKQVSYIRLCQKGNHPFVLFVFYDMCVSYLQEITLLFYLFFVQDDVARSIGWPGSQDHVVFGNFEMKRHILPWVYKRDCGQHNHAPSPNTSIQKYICFFLTHPLQLSWPRSSPFFSSSSFYYGY